MEGKPNKSKSKLNIRTISSDIVVQTVNNNKSNKNIKKCQKCLQNFISIKKKLKFKSAFDCKGAKIFLAEKSKAMEVLILEDEIIPEKRNKKCTSHSCNKKKKNCNNSIDNIVPFKLNNFKNNKKDIKKYKISTKTVSDYFINNIKDIGKIIQKNNKKYLGNIKNKDYLDNDLNEPSYLMTSENDSLIYSIVKQMSSNINN